jgi:predicted secreted protein
MKARGNSAGTSQDEKTSAAPSVAKLFIPNGGRGELRALGGGKHDEWNQRLTAQLAGSLPEARGSMTAATVEGYRSAGPGRGYAERPNDRGERRRA